MFEFEVNDNLPPQTKACLRLWAAVFHRAMIDMAIEFRAKRTMPFWLISNRRYPGSFVWLCELFSLDPDYVRSVWRANVRRILSMSEEDR